MNREGKAELISKIVGEIQEAKNPFLNEMLTERNMAALESVIQNILRKELDNWTPKVSVPTVKVRQMGPDAIEVQFLDEDSVPWQLYPLLKKGLGL
jgi:hypothetical protein